jgi:hypothetical protein
MESSSTTIGNIPDSRCHQALDGNAPNPRAVEPPHRSPVVAVPLVGGLHHRYRRCA